MKKGKQHTNALLVCVTTLLVTGCGDANQNNQAQNQGQAQNQARTQSQSNAQAGTNQVHSYNQATQLNQGTGYNQPNQPGRYGNQNLSGQANQSTNQHSAGQANQSSNQHLSGQPNPLSNQLHGTNRWLDKDQTNDATNNDAANLSRRDPDPNRFLPIEKQNPTAIELSGADEPHKIVHRNTTTIQAITASLTREQAVAKYRQYYDAYRNDDWNRVLQYRQAYSNIKGSLADKIVERAVWYMEHGYTVYGHGWNSYPSNGIVDCSEFTKLVYGDFGYKLTDVSKEYGTVGTRVSGVYAKQDPTTKKWKLYGTENLKPGDILCWWKNSSIDGSKIIGHVAIYMGMLNGQPAVLGTGDYNPTSLGIVNDFRYWYGSNFWSAQRVLPTGSWTAGKVMAGHEGKPPVVPTKYVLPPQRTVPRVQ